MAQFDTQESRGSNRTRDNRGQWRVEQSKLEEYIAAAYEKTAESLKHSQD